MIATCLPPICGLKQIEVARSLDLHIVESGKASRSSVILCDEQTFGTLSDAADLVLLILEKRKAIPAQMRGQFSKYESIESLD